MTFGSIFGRVLSPTFQDKSQITGGVWWLAGGISSSDCVAAYQPKGAASYAESLINLANPGTYNAREGTAPDWSASNGWEFISANKDYLKTGITNGNGYSLVIRFSDYDYTKSNFQAFFIGSSIYDGKWKTQNIWASIYAGNYVKYEYGFETSGDQKLNNTYGVLAICKNNGYLNGSLVKSITGYDEASGGEIQICKGYGNEYVHAKIQAAAIYNVELTSTQVSALTNAMNTL